MGQPIYVLTTLVEGNEWRPVAVVTDEYVADQWIREGKDNDWIPLELDDLSTTGMAKAEKTPFKPRKPKPNDQAQQNINDQLMKANVQLKQLVEDLTEKLKSMKPKRGAASNPLLQSGDEEV